MPQPRLPPPLRLFRRLSPHPLLLLSLLLHRLLALAAGRHCARRTQTHQWRARHLLQQHQHTRLRLLHRSSGVVLALARSAQRMRYHLSPPSPHSRTMPGWVPAQSVLRLLLLLLVPELLARITMISSREWPQSRSPLPVPPLAVLRLRPLRLASRLLVYSVRTLPVEAGMTPQSCGRHRRSRDGSRRQWHWRRYRCAGQRQRWHSGVEPAKRRLFHHSTFRCSS